MDKDLSKYQLECCDTLGDSDVLEASRKALEADENYLTVDKAVEELKLFATVLGIYGAFACFVVLVLWMGGVL